MNCKQGDLAVIVQSMTMPQHIGKILRIGLPVHMLGLPGWAIVGPQVAGYYFIADRCVRPIRDQPGADETIEWAGLPAEVTA